MKTVGERLKELREDRGLTQSELGDAIQVRQTTISEIERGSNMPSLRVLYKLADFFNVQPGHFLDGAIEVSRAEVA